MESLLNLLNHANHLKQLPRMGWLFANVQGPESVADHTCVTALLAMFLADVINEEYAGQGLEDRLDIGHVVQLALLHDFAESQLTDLPKRSTTLLGKEVKHRAEEEAIFDLFSSFSNPQRYHTLWAEYNTATTPEARVVRDADKLEMVHQALRYAQRGHTNLNEFWQGHKWFYPASQMLFTHLLDRYKS